ncbi:unnamed protein product, partial [Rotaria sp. Silwood1]
DPRVSSQSDDSIYDLYTIPKDAGESTSSTKTLVASEGSRLFDLNTAGEVHETIIFHPAVGLK